MIRLTTLATILCLACLASAGADDERIEVEAEAPAGHAVLEHTTGGAFFVAKDLKRRYDDLVGRVRTLRERVAAQHVPTEEALLELETLTTQLETLRKEVETAKVRVQPMHAYTRKTETIFQLGAEQRLILTGDLVHVVGWEGPGVKCVVEKTVYGPEGDEPKAAEFDAIHVVHRLRVATDLVGQTAAEHEAEQAEYRESEEGRKLTEEQWANRNKFVREIRDSYIPYTDYQGREVDTIELAGLTHEEGNRYFSVRITSPDGGGTFGGDWRRHARMTVYVPPCRGVLLRGCLVGLDVEKLEAPLIVTSSGSRDRDYQGEFRIRGLKGPLDLYNVPLHELTDVAGDVAITSTVDRTNSGNHHVGGQWISYTTPAEKCDIRDVTGDLSAWFARSDLQVAGISGRLDVRNEYGDTRVSIANPLEEAAHRVVTESGRIDVHLANRAVLGELPILALTNHGTVRTNVGRPVFDDSNFTSGNDTGGSRRNWRGLVSASDSPDPLALFHRMNRPEQVLAGEDRDPGLDLISRAGTIAIEFAAEDE